MKNDNFETQARQQILDVDNIAKAEVPVRKSGTLVSAMFCMMLFAGSSSSALADAALPGGLFLDNHWTYDEVLFNKSATKLMANFPSSACRLLIRVPEIGRLLALACTVETTVYKNVARLAIHKRQCFRVVIPGHLPGLRYPSIYKGGRCR